MFYLIINIEVMLLKRTPNYILYMHVSVRTCLDSAKVQLYTMVMNRIKNGNPYECICLAPTVCDVQIGGIQSVIITTGWRG